VDLLPHNHESAGYLDLNLSQPAGAGNSSTRILNLNDPIPIPVIQFERYYQLANENTKAPEVP
jgi:hypothetical protein